MFASLEWLYGDAFTEEVPLIRTDMCWVYGLILQSLPRLCHTHSNIAYLLQHLFSPLSTLKYLSVAWVWPYQLSLQNGGLARVLLRTSATIFPLLHSCKYNLWDLVQWWLWALFRVPGLYNFSKRPFWGHECTLCWMEMHSDKTEENSHCSCCQSSTQSLCDLECWSWIHCFIHVGNVETLLGPARWSCTDHFMECPSSLYMCVVHLSEALRPGTTDTAFNMVPGVYWRYYPL